ncbi:MAG: hypothetical protein ABJ251_08455 [Paracoccaceae bacterium]
MWKACLTGLTVLMLSAGQTVAAPATGEQTYDLLFRDGTLDSVDRNTALVYRREVTNVLKPDAEFRDTGDIALSFQKEDTSMAHLEFRREDKHRALGIFPASVGNPMIMFFYETVVRDMAEAAGGSPFYIRNRVKDSLIQPADIETGEAVFDGKTVETKTIRLYPFAKDPNKDRMQGFGDLVLTVTMSDAVPGWYLSLVAETDSQDGPTVYRSALDFEGLETSE